MHVEIVISTCIWQAALLCVRVVVFTEVRIRGIGTFTVGDLCFCSLRFSVDLKKKQSENPLAQTNTVVIVDRCQRRIHCHGRH